MTRSRLAPRPRSVRLAVSRLEDRLTPTTTIAKAVYDGSSRTLTITATATDANADQDKLTVTASPGKPTGFLTVTDGTNAVVFRSEDKPDRPVRHLYVKFDQVPDGALALDNTVRLGGALAVFGGKASTALTSADATYGGSVSFVGKGAADTLTFTAGTRVGGKLLLDMGSGTNVANLEGGFIGGSLEVNGLDGTNTVNLVGAADLRVSGWATVNLGDGTNVLRAAGANLIDVGHGFKYKGGTGTDTITLRDTGDPGTFNATLRTGGNAAFDLDKTPIPAGANVVLLDRLTIGDDLTVTGGGADDTVRFSGPVVTGGALNVNLKAGTNKFNPNLNHLADNVRIGGQFNYSGGDGVDQVRLNGALVGGATTVKLGNSPTNDDVDDGDPTAHQFFKTGEYVDPDVDPNNPDPAHHNLAPVTFLGAVTVKGGLKSNNIIHLYRAYFSAGIDVQTLDGTDRVRINDSDISGLTHIDTGGGADKVGIESVLKDDNGDFLTGASSFGGNVRISTGLGDDTVNLVAPSVADPNTYCKAAFGSPVILDGSGGKTAVDTLNVGPNASFLAPGNKDSGFEQGDHLP